MRLAARGASTCRPNTISALVAICVVVWSAACGRGTGLFRQYEYEEELYLSLDASATIYVNSSITALNILRGASFDHAVEASEVKAYFTAPGADVTRVSFSRRNDRRYVHVRLRVDDVRRLGSTPRFAWSSYEFERDGEVYVYRQRVGAGATPVGGEASWRGDEIVAFRVHVPSKVVYHNVDRVRRGNILAWEQPLTDRLAGRPIEIEARMQTQSILYRTLGLFGLTLLLVAALFGAVLWWVARQGGRGTAARARPGARV